VLEKAIVLTSRSQSQLGGWLYTPNSRGDEGSVTVTQVQALRACRNAGIKVPKKTIDKSVKYIEKSARSDGGIAYRASGGGSSRPAISAAAVAVLYNAGQYESPYANRGLKYIVKNVKVAGGGRVFGHYFYAHLYMAQAMYTAGAREPKYWDDYYPKMRDALIKRQNKGDGSWMGDSVGTVYGTAIACMILQLPYNTLPIMQR
jgi:prenyltransferase beta subunit